VYLNSGTINLLETKPEFRFSLPPRKWYICPSPSFISSCLLPLPSPFHPTRPLSLLVRLFPIAFVLRPLTLRRWSILPRRLNTSFSCATRRRQSLNFRLTIPCTPNSTQLVFVGASSRPRNLAPSSHHLSSLLYVILIYIRLALTGWFRRHCRLGLDHESQPRVALHMESCMDSSQGLLSVLPVREFLRLSCKRPDTPRLVFSYWVLAVGCFLLYCFVNDHSLELCLKIYKVGIHCYPHREHSRCLTSRRYPSHLLCGTS